MARGGLERIFHKRFRLKISLPVGLVDIVAVGA